ncbi:g protein-coupled receptor [Anaeramoeba ignava]|uniref:G protein-coupled receptor n=1 Tax=Anaeramoeba ignava TaxID=1746090 RepID=A0A9Q0R8F5_ANAIG|nr:g protein-coupled receptor [Anaeramoeba ignava]
MVSNLVIVFCVIGSTLGIFGSSFFIIVYLSFEEIRTRFRLFVLTLSIYNFLIDVSLLLPGFTNHKICLAQSFLTNYSFSEAYFWIFLIALIYYLEVCKGYNCENSIKFYWISNLFIQIIGLLFGILIVVFGNPTKETSYWCSDSTRWLMSIEYSFVAVALLGALILYSLVVHKIRKEKDPVYSKSFQIKMLSIAILYILTELWNIIKRVWQIFQNTKNSNDFFDATQAFFTPLIGFWDFVFFVWGDKLVWALLLNKCTSRSFITLRD